MGTVQVGHMETRIVAAAPSAREALRNLFQLYAYDFSEVLPLEVAETGRFEVESAIDTCWADSSRFPFLTRRQPDRDRVLDESHCCMHRRAFRRGTARRRSLVRARAAVHEREGIVRAGLSLLAARPSSFRRTEGSRRPL